MANETFENASGKRKVNVLQLLGIFSLCSLSACGSAITASLQLIGDMFPAVPYTSITLLETAPALASIPFCVLSGLIAGKKCSFRLLAAIGIGGIAVFGALPFFLTGFTPILISRFLLGASMGVVLPLCNSVSVLTLPPKTISFAVGLMTVVQGLGLFALQNLANRLVKTATPNVWLCYLVAIVPLVIMLLFLKEPEKKPEAPAPAQSASAQPAHVKKHRLPGVIWPLGILILLFSMFIMPASSGLSEIVVGDGIGTVGDATRILNIYNIVVLGVGLVFGPIFKCTRRFTMYIGLVLISAALAVMGFAFRLSLLTACFVVFGIGQALCSGTFVMEFNLVCPHSRIAIGSAIALSMSALGTFFASGWYGIVEKAFDIDSMRIVMFISAGCIALVLVIHLIIQKHLRKTVEANVDAHAIRGIKIKGSAPSAR